MDWYKRQYEQYDRNVENDWPMQISSDTRNDWWHAILKRSGASERGLNSSKQYSRIIEQALAEDDDRDINKLDSRGKTALHAAARSRNSGAVLALLHCGADVNVVDVHGYTAPTCVEIKDRMPELMYFKHHIRKLAAFGMYVSDLNMKFYCEECPLDEDDWVGSADRVSNDRSKNTIHRVVLERIIKNCNESIEKMKGTKVDERTTLYRVFRDGAEQLAYSPVKLREIEKLVKANARADQCDKSFRESFTLYRRGNDLRDLLALVYRRACSRRKLLPAVEDALKVLFKADLPGPSCEAVIRNLNDFDLANVIKAASFKQD